MLESKGRFLVNNILFGSAGSGYGANPNFFIKKRPEHLLLPPPPPPPPSAITSKSYSYPTHLKVSAICVSPIDC